MSERSALSRLARARVPLGFASAALGLWLADPAPWSLAAGIPVAIAGEGLRVWAAGHLEKGREVTRSGPYRYMRHPLYAGSTLMAIGFVIASRSVMVAICAAAYLGSTLYAAIRTEEATLDSRFAGEYSAYRDGRAVPVPRRFSVERVMRNREYRAALGLLTVILFLVLRWQFGRG